MEEISGAMVSGTASKLNNKISKSTVNDKDDWARNVQASISLNDDNCNNNNLSTSSVSSVNWIKAFRTQNYGQDISIPCVKSQFDENERDEIPILPSPTTMKVHSLKKREQTHVDFHTLTDDEVLSDTSVKLVQDYIDFSSAINPRTPKLSHRHVTSVTKNDLRPPASSTKDHRNYQSSSSPPLKSHYSGMDKDDYISLIAPKYHSIASIAETNPKTSPFSFPSQPQHQQPQTPASSYDQTAPSLSIISIQSPRSHTGSRPKRVPLELPVENSKNVSGGNSLMGIGGDILERDSVYLSVPQSGQNNNNHNNNNNITTTMTTTSTSTGIAVSGTSFSPIKPTHRKQHQSEFPLSDSLDDPRDISSRARARSREIHMQLPIPGYSLDFTDSITSISAASPRRPETKSKGGRSAEAATAVAGEGAAGTGTGTEAAREAPPAPALSSSGVGVFQDQESQLLHKSSVLTKYVTENTQNILNQYLSSNPSSRPCTHTQNSQRTHIARAVTPSLQVSWHEELQEQQRALRTIFQSKRRSKPSKPQTPLFQHKATFRRATKPTSITTLSSAPPPPLSISGEAKSVTDSPRSWNLRNQGGHGGSHRVDSDSASEIQSVLNQMSRSEVASETIKPLERYHDQNEDMLDDIFDRLESFEQGTSQGNGQGNGEERGSARGTREEVSPTPPMTQKERKESQQQQQQQQNEAKLQSNPSHAPRLLLKSPRLAPPPSLSSALPPSVPFSSSSSHSQTQTQTRISLPVVNGPPQNGPSDGTSITSLSLSTLPSPSDIDKEARKTMSRRILRTHQPSSTQSSSSAVKRGNKMNY